MIAGRHVLSQKSQCGMTIIEVLIAILILGLTTGAVVTCIVTGDKIGGRRTGKSYCTLLARNEAERLRAYESSVTLPNDTAYTASVNGVDFYVVRTRIRNDSLLTDSVVAYAEYAISVKRKTDPGQAVFVRLLQGFYAE